MIWLTVFILSVTCLAGLLSEIAKADENSGKNYGFLR